MTRGKESPNLDLMRSSAVLFVVLFHTLLVFQKTKFWRLNLHQIGQWGVLIFFVHTSLVLMFSLERQNDRDPDGGLFLPFYVRRCFRVFPLSVLAVLFVAFFHWPVGNLHQGQFQFVQLNRVGLASNILLVQNLTHSESILAVLWSLPFEMQMYLVLPALYLLTRVTRTWLPILGFWAITVVAATGAIKLEHLAGLLLYAPCFASGVVAYRLSKSCAAKLPFLLWPVAIAVLTVAFLQTATFWSAWICCLLLGLAIPQFREMSNAWLRKVVQLIARYSYGIYITHFICLWLAFGRFNYIRMPFQWLMFAVTATAAPVILYHAVEEPMILLGSRWVTRMTPKRPQYRDVRA